MSEIDELRTEIAAIDTEIMKLAGRRIAVAERIGAYKRQHGLAVVVPSVETAVKKRYADDARKWGVPETTAEQIADILMKACRNVQDKSGL